MLAPLFLCYGIWTQYLDIKLVWGWQNGAYMGMLTHWTFTLTLLFLLLSTLVDFGAPLKGAKTKFMYLAIAETLVVDIGFYVVELPRIRKEFSKHSWISTHKHFFNLVWILAIAAEEKSEIIPASSEFLSFGLFAPTGLHLGYYIFARTMAQPESGKWLLRILGIPEPEEDKSISELWRESTELSKRGNITMFPGRWMYPGFHSNTLTLVFAMAHVITLPISYGLLSLIQHSKGARSFCIWFGVVATPFLYSDEYDDYIFAEFVATLLGVENFRDNPPVVFEQYHGFALWTRDVLHGNFGTRDQVLEFLWQASNDILNLDIRAFVDKLTTVAGIWLDIGLEAADWMFTRFITASAQLSRRVSKLIPSREDLGNTYKGVKQFVSSTGEALRRNEKL